MSRILAGAAAAAALGFALITLGYVVTIPTTLLVDSNGDPTALAVPLMLVPATILLLVAPIVSGMAGGLLSGRFVGVIGSVAGFLIGAVAAAIAQGAGTADRPIADPMAAVFFGLFVVVGHVSGLAIRPHRIPA
jgi:hypothetical protein